MLLLGSLVLNVEGLLGLVDLGISLELIDQLLFGQILQLANGNLSRTLQKNVPHDPHCPCFLIEFTAP